MNWSVQMIRETVDKKGEQPEVVLNYTAHYLNVMDDLNVDSGEVRRIMDVVNVTLTRAYDAVEGILPNNSQSLSEVFDRKHR